MPAIARLLNHMVMFLRNGHFTTIDPNTPFPPAWVRMGQSSTDEGVLQTFLGGGKRSVSDNSSQVSAWLKPQSKKGSNGGSSVSALLKPQSVNSSGCSRLLKPSGRTSWVLMTLCRFRLMMRNAKTPVTVGRLITAKIVCSKYSTVPKIGPRVRVSSNNIKRPTESVGGNKYGGKTFRREDLNILRLSCGQLVGPKLRLTNFGMSLPLSDRCF